LGGASEATKQQQQINLQASQQQLGFDKQLMDLFQKQYANQKGVLDFLQSTLKPIVAQSLAGHGFDAATEAAMRTSATEGLTNEFQHAQMALNQQLKTAGDANVPSGVTAGLDTALLNQEAQAKAGAQREITVRNAALANSNLWNAINALGGNAAQANPLGYASSATGGSGAIAGLGESQSALQNAITSANSNSFFGKLGGAFASSLGSGLGSALTGGLGTGVSMMGSGNFGW
jgi:hypothetical protein